MNADFWNDKAEWLKTIRTGWLNEDYIQFLIEKVWRINKPVNIVDFGCGFGYVGLIFLPLLPKGSTYTGIDISENLIKEAKSIFQDSGYDINFIQVDLNEYQPVCKYDIAISQAVLRHIPNAETILGKMIKSVLTGGFVICMETDLELEKAGLYFKGMNYGELGITALMRKLWEKELSNGGRDYRFAIKIPALMQEYGLHDVGVRMNDSVYFIHPNNPNYIQELETLSSAWGWRSPLTEEDRDTFVNSLMSKGLDENEAEAYFRGEQKIREYMSQKNTASVVKAPCTLISYGIR